jgi:hypothetical protein
VFGRYSPLDPANRHHYDEGVWENLIQLIVIAAILLSFFEPTTHLARSLLKYLKDTPVRLLAILVLAFTIVAVHWFFDAAIENVLHNAEIRNYYMFMVMFSVLGPGLITLLWLKVGEGYACYSGMIAAFVVSTLALILYSNFGSESLLRIYAPLVVALIGGVAFDLGSASGNNPTKSAAIGLFVSVFITTLIGAYVSTKAWAFPVLTLGWALGLLLAPEQDHAL